MRAEVPDWLKKEVIRKRSLLHEIKEIVDLERCWSADDMQTALEKISELVHVEIAQTEGR